MGGKAHLIVILLGLRGALYWKRVKSFQFLGVRTGYK